MLNSYDKCRHVGAATQQPDEIEAKMMLADWEKNQKVMDKNGNGVIQYVIIKGQNGMENIWLRRFPTKKGFVDHEKMYEDTIRIFKSLNIGVDPIMKIGNLSVSERQMIEIVK